MVAMIPKYFGTRTTGAGISHLPKVVLIKTGQTLRVNTNLINPDVSGFIIADMDGNPQTIFG